MEINILINKRKNYVKKHTTDRVEAQGLRIMSESRAKGYKCLVHIFYKIKYISKNIFASCMLSRSPSYRFSAKA